MKTIVCVSLDAKELERFRVENPNLNFSAWVREQIRNRVTPGAGQSEDFERAYLKAEIVEEEEVVECVRGIKTAPSVLECKQCDQKGCKQRMYPYRY